MGLDVDETIAQLLVTEGFGSPDEISAIEGFDIDVAEEIKLRASQYIEDRNKDNEDKRIELGVTDELSKIDKISTEMLVILGQNSIKTLDDLGDLANDELLELFPNS